MFEKDSPYYGMSLQDIDPALKAELWATGGIVAKPGQNPAPTAKQANEEAIRAEIEANGGSGSRGTYDEQSVFDQIVKEEAEARAKAKAQQEKNARDAALDLARTPSDYEKAVVERAVGQHQRLSDLYYPIQERMAKEAGKDFTHALASRANADINAASANSLAGAHRAAADGGFALDSVGNTGRLSEVTDAVGSGRADSYLAAKQAAQNTIDAKRQGVVGLSYGLESAAGAGSLNLAKDAVNSSLTHATNRLGILDAQNAAKLAKKQARKGVIGSVLGSVVSGGVAGVMSGLIPVP